MDLEGLMFFTFLEKISLKNDSVRRLWNTFLNAAIQSIDEQYGDQWIACYKSINWWLTSYIERRESRVKFSGRWVAFNPWLWMIGVIRSLDSSGTDELYLPVTGSLYLLTGRDCPDPDKTTLTYRRVKTQGVRVDSTVWSYMSHSLSCFANLCSVIDLREEKAGRATPLVRTSYTVVFCFRLKWYLYH